MSKWNLLTPKAGLNKATLLLSAYNLAVALVRNNPGEGAVIIQITNCHGLLAYWVGLDSCPGPELSNADGEVLTWIAPTECWPSAESLGLKRDGVLLSGRKDGTL